MNINSDVGELNRLLADGTYSELFKYIDSANIACGGHAGNQEMMQRMINLAIDNEVEIGAHPSYPDKENFGRIEIDLDSTELFESISEQIQTLKDLCPSSNELKHVKPHGALYNRAAKDEDVAQIVAEAIMDVDTALKVVGLAGSKMIEIFTESGLEVIPEAFADRTYEANGSLRDRKFEDALIVVPQKAADQSWDISQGFVVAVNGEKVPISAKTICIHSDTSNALAIAKAINIKIKVNNE